MVWLRFGLARFGLAKFGSQINGIGFSEAACKISAQLDLIWLSYSFFMFCLVRLKFGLAMFSLAMFSLAKLRSQINGMGFLRLHTKFQLNWT